MAAIAVSTSARPQLMRQIFSAKPGGAWPSRATTAFGATRLIAPRSSRGHLAEALGVARGIALHGLDQHVAPDRAGGGAARHAVLDDDGAGAARVVGRPEADENRVVARGPRQLRLGDAQPRLAPGGA